MQIRTMLTLALAGSFGAGLWANSVKVINGSKGTWGLDPMAKFVAVPALGRQPWEEEAPWPDAAPAERRSVVLDLMGKPAKQLLNPNEVAVISEESLEVGGSFFRLVDAHGLSNALLWVGSSPSGSSGGSRLEVRCLPASGNAPWVRGIVRLESSWSHIATFNSCRVKDIAVIQADAWPVEPFPEGEVMEAKSAVTSFLDAQERKETKALALSGDSTITWPSGLAMESMPVSCP